VMEMEMRSGFSVVALKHRWAHTHLLLLVTSVVVMLPCTFLLFQLSLHGCYMTVSAQVIIFDLALCTVKYPLGRAQLGLGCETGSYYINTMFDILHHLR
jgi:hypothetical protein